MATPVYNGVDEIMSFYDTVNEMGDFCYSVWLARDICFQYPFKDGDAQHARKFFQDNFIAMEQAGNKAMLWVKFHPKSMKGDFIDRNSKTISNTPVRACALEDGDLEQIGAVQQFHVGRPGNNSEQYRMFEAIENLKKLPEVINTAIDEKMTAYEERLKQLEEPETPEPDTLGRIMGFVDKNPGIVETVFTMLRSFIPQPLPQQQINGTMESQNSTLTDQQNVIPQPGNDTDREVDNDMLDKALDRLMLAGVEIDTDLTALADYAEKNPVIFKQMLLMIRSK